MESFEKPIKPSIDDVISLDCPVNARTSPHGGKVAYTVRTTNWTDNLYEHLCYVHEDSENTQLTRKGNVLDFHWLNEDSLLLLREDQSKEEKPNVYLYEDLTGDPIRLTDHETGVQAFKPFADGVIYLADDPERKKNKERENKYGKFIHWEMEESASALYYINIKAYKKYLEQAKIDPEPEKPVLELSKLLSKPLKIFDFQTNKRDTVYINCRTRDDLVYSKETSSYRITFDPGKALKEYLEHDNPGDTETGEITKLALPKGATIVGVSPRESRLLVMYKERDLKGYTQPDLFIIDESHCMKTVEHTLGKMVKISEKMDYGWFNVVKWTGDGVYVGYADGTKSVVARLTINGDHHQLDLNGIYPMNNVDISEGGYMAFAGTNAAQYPEIYASDKLESGDLTLKKVTSYEKQVADWDLGVVETIRWRSRDGTMIEGILRKPSSFDPQRKYPLLFDVHGGPSWVSREFLLEPYDFQRYPVVQFNNKDVLIVKPNYRGSIGYGQAFMELNVNNLGVGDLWDLESCIDHLSEQGIIDEDKVGCMGWSQGGYISAMATTSSDRFCATSVGAGISDWYTYHISNDIPHFTTDYLSGSPFRDRELYLKTSPMTKIKEAKTPTLIQHGVKDQRVPFSDAMELYRGLKEMKVPVELYAYPEMAHPITKPRECRAVSEQNLAWFSHYLLGEKLELPD